MTTIKGDRLTEKVTASGLLENDDLFRIRPTDNGLKEGDPTEQPSQDPKPLELDENGIPLYMSGE